MKGFYHIGLPYCHLVQVSGCAEAGTINRITELLSRVYNEGGVKITVSLRMCSGKKI